MDHDDNIDLEYIKMKPNIIKVMIRSRHINSKTYKCNIEFKPDSIGYGGILRHSCDCANGGVGYGQEAPALILLQLYIISVM